ncbi:hypothetical protein BsWGS_28427 [Bradybaena similaris]
MATDTECVVHLLLLCGISSFGAGQEIKTGICYQGWHYYQKHSYGLGGDQVTWADAEDVCKEFDSGLAEIETDEENQFIKNLVMSQLGKGT